VPYVQKAIVGGAQASKEARIGTEGYAVDAESVVREGGEWGV
jgi:hypothetical protein